METMREKRKQHKILRQVVFKGTMYIYIHVCVYMFMHEKKCTEQLVDSCCGLVGLHQLRVSLATL